jgi:hypothetical protein
MNFGKMMVSLTKYIHYPENTIVALSFITNGDKNALAIERYITIKENTLPTVEEICNGFPILSVQLPAISPFTNALSEERWKDIQRRYMSIVQ